MSNVQGSVIFSCLLSENSMTLLHSRHMAGLTTSTKVKTLNTSKQPDASVPLSSELNSAIANTASNQSTYKPDSLEVKMKLIANSFIQHYKHYKTTDDTLESVLAFIGALKRDWESIKQSNPPFTDFILIGETLSNWPNNNKLSNDQEYTLTKIEHLASKELDFEIEKQKNNRSPQKPFNPRIFKNPNQTMIATNTSNTTKRNSSETNSLIFPKLKLPS